MQGGSVKFVPHPGAKARSSLGAPPMVGEYVLGKTLGEGSCAAVKLGTHCKTGKQVAIKIIRPSTLREQKELLREVAALQILKQHPHIIQLLDVVKEGGCTCLIMELAEGGELFDYVADYGRFTEEYARKLFRQILSGILYCHANLVIHRDLKPENLVIDSEGNVKITDFGLSNVINPGFLFSTFCGSPIYTSPEIVLHKHYNGALSESWSLGVVLYVMVTGGMPWRMEKNSVQDMDALLKADFALPDCLGLSEECKNLITCLLTAESSQRLSIEKVAQHPWVCKGYREPINFNLKKKPLIAERQINEDVLANLELLAMNVQKARVSIQTDPYSPALTAYHKLLEKCNRGRKLAKDIKIENSLLGSPSPNSRRRAISTPVIKDGAEVKPYKQEAGRIPELSLEPTFAIPESTKVPSKSRFFRKESLKNLFSFATFRRSLSKQHSPTTSPSQSRRI